MILAQTVPNGAIGTETLLYAVPTGGELQLDQLVVCNQTNVAKAYRVRMAKKGEEAAQNKQYVQGGQTGGPVGTTINAASTHYLTGFSLTDGDLIYVSADSALVSFSLYGRIN